MDYTGLGEVVTTVLPVYDKSRNPPTFLGVVGNEFS